MNLGKANFVVFEPEYMSPKISNSNLADKMANANRAIPDQMLMKKSDQDLNSLPFHQVFSGINVLKTKFKQKEYCIKCLKFEDIYYPLGIF